MSIVSNSRNLRRRVIPLSLLALLPIATGCDRTDHYNKGMQLLEQKEYTKAHIEFRKAMRGKQPTPETYYEAGVTAMELKANGDAKTYLNMADNLAGPRSKLTEDIKTRLAQLAMMDRDFKGARDISKWVLERYPKNSRARETLVLCLTALAEPDSAAKELDLWLAADPQSQQARMVRSGVLLSKDDLDTAVKEMEDAAEQPSRTPKTLIALGNLYQLQGQLAKAEQAYRKASELDPENVEPRKGLGYLYARMGKSEQAEATFRKLGELKPKDPDARDALAGYYLSQHKWPQAIAELERLRKLDPKAFSIRQNLASAYLLAGQKINARELVKELQRTDPTNYQVCLLAGILAFQEDRLDEALVQLNSSMEYKPQAVTEFFIGSSQDRKGNERQAQVAMTRALQMDSHMLGARLWLVDYWLRQSSPLSALALLDKDPMAKNPSPLAQLQRARCFAALGQFPQAAATLSAVHSQNPQIVPVYYQTAMQFLLKKQWAQARPALEEGLLKEPASINLLAVLAQTYIADGKADKAVERVRQQAEKYPNSYLHFQLLAETQIADRDLAAAKDSYARAVALGPNAPGPLLGLTRALVLAGRNEDARTKLNELIRRWPNWTDAWTTYGAFLEMQADYPEATAIYEKAVALDGSNALALNNLAWRLYSDGGDTDRALQLAQKAHDAQPENAAFADTLGMIYLRVGSRSEAEKALSEAVKLQPGNVQFQQHLSAVQGKRR